MPGDGFCGGRLENISVSDMGGGLIIYCYASCL